MRPAPVVLSLLLAACAAAPTPPGPTAPAAPQPTSPVAASSSATPVAPAEPALLASAAPVAPPAASAKPAPSSPPPIPTGTAVLHIGDSFAVAGFAQALKPHMAALGVRYEVRAETSSFTTTWAARMDLLVANTQPDLVIINLGANEFTNTDPPAHAPAIRRIVKSIGNRPCVWVSPPSWRKDTGITEVMRQNTAPCRFFDSDVLVKTPIPRQGDKIHPSEAGGAIWAEAFWAWLNEQRAPADDGAIKGSPWRLLPAPPEEHRAAVVALPTP
jgi:lysophospholipase L1-like esterase